MGVKHGTPLSEVASSELLAQWDYEKNGGLTPDDVTFGSGRKVWWRCNEGHSWCAQIASRFSGGYGCPYCSGHFAIPGVTDLETCCPDIASEWDIVRNGALLPKNVTVGSLKLVWWKCKIGHSYQHRIVDRTKQNAGCPYCSGRKILQGFNDLGSQYPELAREWDYENNIKVTPESVTCGTSLKVWWICPVGHSYQASVSERTRDDGHGSGCPYCSGRKVLRGFNDLMTVRPDIGAEWDFDKNVGFTPYMVTVRSGKRAWWRCPVCHGSYDAIIANRTGGKNCPYCAGKRVLVGFNDLQSQRPDIAADWCVSKNNGLSPENVTVGCGKSVWWTCSLGHNYKSSICNRTGRGSGCPYCSSEKLLVGFNDLQTKRPDIALEWDFSKNNDVTPTDVMPSSGRKFWWKCRNGHSWLATVNNRTNKSGERGCPYCSVSNGEQLLRSILSDCDFLCIEQWRIKECRDSYSLSFDFAIFADEHDEFPLVCIEYQGRQHYQPVEYFGGKRALKPVNTSSNTSFTFIIFLLF